MQKGANPLSAQPFYVTHWDSLSSIVSLAWETCSYVIFRDLKELRFTIRRPAVSSTPACAPEAPSSGLPMGCSRFRAALGPIPVRVASCAAPPCSSPPPPKCLRAPLQTKSRRISAGRALPEVLQSLLAPSVRRQVRQQSAPRRFSPSPVLGTAASVSVAAPVLA